MARTQIFGTQIEDNTITDVDIAVSAAISGSKIAANFGSQTLIVDTNTLYVDSTGHQVGIGTASPGKKLDVLGDIRVSGNNSLFLGRFTATQEAALTGGLGSNDGGSMWFNTTTSEFMGWSGTVPVILG